MNTTKSIALVSLLLVSACAPLRPAAAPAPPAPSRPTTPPAPAAVSTPTVVAGPAPTVDTCPAGQKPSFVYGFAGLKARLGDLMGDALTCERPGPEGDSLQQTTTGMARYQKSTNVPSFVAGDEHWALTARGLVYWRGRSLDAPDDAQVIADDSELSPASPDTLQRQQAPSRPVVSSDLIQLPEDSGPPIMPEAPAWLQLPLALLREYDRRNGTVLVPSVVRSGVSVGHLGGADGAWGLFIPSAHRIVLDASLANETPQAIAPVLGHEADHARDTFQYGPPRSDAACYTFEITAFALQARIWASLYGPSGMQDPSTDLEHELNLILETSRTKANTLIGAIKDNYKAECG